MMEPTKFYKLTTLGLLLLNVAILAFFLLTKPTAPNAPPFREGMRSHATDIFDFDKEQEVSFKKLAKQHHQQLQAIHEQQRKLLPNYFKSLTDSVAEYDTEIVLEELQKIEQEKLLVTKQHLLAVKNILNEEQIVHFREFVDRILSTIVAKGRKRPPPPKDN